MGLGAGGQRGQKENPGRRQCTVGLMSVSWIARRERSNTSILSLRINQVNEEFEAIRERTDRDLGGI